MNKIALIVDMPNWAFDIEANLLKEKLQNFYNIDVICANDEKYDNNLFLILESVRNYDIIHFFWRKLLIQFNSEEFKLQVTQNGYDYNDYVNYFKTRISTGIYDHLFLEKDEIKLYEPIYKNFSKMYYTCSKRLENIYNSIESYPHPCGTIHDTYDNKLYSGGDKLRFKNKDVSKPLVIGWIGNSKWNIKYQDFKGFHSILEPVITELINEGYNIERHYADKNIKFRTNEEMPSYYQEIDVCVVVSTLEGTPRPIIEAMASGVPIITTDVGIVPEVLGPKQKEFIIGNRNNGSNDEIVRNNLKEKIIYLYNNCDYLYKLSKENYEYAPNNDIDHLYLEYKRYFDDFLNN